MLSDPAEQCRPCRTAFLTRWVRRLGPAGSLALVLGSLTLLLLGCYALRDREPWKRPVEPRPPPEIHVDRMVRVRLLGRRPQAAVTLHVASPLVMTDVASGRPVQRDGMHSLPACTVLPGESDGIYFGERYVDSSDVLITPKRDASIVVNGKTYRGLLRVRHVDGGLSFTNHIDVESYLRGVLRGELPRRFHPESFKAQCVAARTYVLYQMQRSSSGGTFDVYDDEGSQMYLGVRGEDGVADRAVEETRGQICVWNDRGRDKIFCTYYSSACGGRSQHVNNFKPNDPDVAPLAGNVVCEDCYLARFYRWDPVKMSKAEVTRRIVRRYPSVASIGTITRLRPKELTPDGRIIRIQLDGSTGENETLVGEDFRLSIGGHKLKSTRFTIETTKDHFVFRDGRGFGHGVGLCQHGMETKARRGRDYRQILSFYYPTSRIKTLYQ